MPTDPRKGASALQGGSAETQPATEAMGPEVRRQFVRGSLILFLGNFLATANNAVAVILIARMLGPNLYGLYTLALVLPGLFQLFIGLGVNSAVVRYAAFHATTGRVDEAKRFTRNATLFLALSGLALSALNYVVAGTLSADYLHRPDLTVYVQEASLAILGAAVLQAATSVAIGWNRMGLASLAQVVQSVVKLLLTPFLILEGLGVLGAIVGQVTSVLLAGVLVVTMLHMAGFTRPRGGPRAFASDVREMLRFGLPIFAGTLASGLAIYYTTLILAAIATNEVVGFYQAAVNFTTIITLVSVATAGALFPAFASLDGSRGSSAPALKYAVKFGAFFIAPATFLLILTSGLLVRVFYGAEFVPSVPYLQLMAAAYLPVVFGCVVFPVFFNGFGRPRLSLLTYLTGAGAVLVLAPIFAVYLRLGADGLIYSLGASYVVSAVAGGLLAKRHMGAEQDVRSTVAILLSSVVSYIGGSLVLGLRVWTPLSLVLSLVVFSGLYLTLAPLTRGINESDLSVLESSLAEAKVLGMVVGKISRYARFVIAMSKR